MAPDLIIRGRRVIAGGAVGPAALHVAGGRIAALAGFAEVPAGCPIFEAGDLAVMAGVVDTHVHVNEPGRGEWEGFASATRAAAAGGVTTLVDMPLNSIPPTTTPAGLARKLEAAAGRLWVDIGFWGGVVPGNRAELAELCGAGALGFKCFLVDSGVDEFPFVGEAEVRGALDELGGLGAPLLVHAELGGPIAEAARARPPDFDPRRYESYLASRPRRAEDEAVALLLRLCRAGGARVHIVHHSSADALPMLRAARSDGLPVSVETCPHYLTFSAEEIPDGATQFKCAPPIREAANREALWGALGEGLIDQIASDHSPCLPALKRPAEGDFLAAWGGIASLQLQLPAVWTEAARRGHGLADLARWMCEAPARHAGLHRRKGRLAPGCDADVVVWDPDASVVVDPAALHHRHPVTPYAGRALMGAVHTTFVRGRVAYQRGVHAAAPPGAALTGREP